MIYFTKNLNYLLKIKDIKKINFAEQIGISRQSLNQYIQGNNYPSFEILVKISNILEITIDDLLKKDLENGDKI